MNRPRGALAIFTDIDGCVLDEERYDVGPAAPVLRELRERGFPLVFCTTKTRAELPALFALVGGPHISVLEDGTAILFPPGTFPGPLRAVSGRVRRTVHGRLLALVAESYARIRRHFQALRRRVRGAVVGFGDLSAREIARLTNLPLEVARRAQRREFDEAFYFAQGSAANERAARRFAAERALRLTCGGRLYHLHGDSDKGRAAALLRTLLAAGGARHTMIALGDSALDAPFLRLADVPVIVPRPDGAPDPELRRRVPRARIAPAPGPAGWACVVRELLETV